MELTHIEHIGIAVKNLEDSIKYYEEVLRIKMLFHRRSKQIKKLKRLSLKSDKQK